MQAKCCYSLLVTVGYAGIGPNKETNMRTRKTADYSPTKKGSKEENQATNARREMLATFASRQAVPEQPSKWHRRMAKRAAGFTIN